MYPRYLANLYLINAEPSLRISTELLLQQHRRTPRRNNNQILGVIFVGRNDCQQLIHKLYGNPETIIKPKGEEKKEKEKKRKMVTTRSASKGAGASGNSSPSSSTMLTRGKSSSGGGGTNNAWAHAPSAVTLFWMAVSLPLVVWDSIYVLLRPLTMEGGALHWPLWVPYALYGEVDHVYGWKAFRARSGFTSAQGALNVAETLLYFAYLWLYFARRREVRGRAPVRGAGSGSAPTQVLTGRPAALAVLIAFSAAVMTLSKTVLYCKLSPLSSLRHAPRPKKKETSKKKRNGAERNIFRN